MISGLETSRCEYSLKISGPAKISALPIRWSTRYTNSARPVRPMSNLVPTDEENARRKVDITETPRSDRLYLLAESPRKQRSANSPPRRLIDAGAPAHD